MVVHYQPWIGKTCDLIKMWLFWYRCIKTVHVIKRWRYILRCTLWEWEKCVTTVMYLYKHNALNRPGIVPKSSSSSAVLLLFYFSSEITWTIFVNTGQPVNTNLTEQLDKLVVYYLNMHLNERNEPWGILSAPVFHLL